VGTGPLPEGNVIMGRPGRYSAVALLGERTISNRMGPFPAGPRGHDVDNNRLKEREKGATGKLG